MSKQNNLLNLIKEYPKTYEEILKEKDISIKTEEDLAIFNYSITSDFHDVIVKDARGMIIDMKELKTVCWPFTKFGNYTDSYADDIDWSTARVQEKIDGSIIKLYYYLDGWYFATNSCINANDALCNNGKSFQQLIEETINYCDILWSKLNKECTYIFELVSPENQIVIKYPEAMLYHIGTRSNITGEELDIDIGMPKPKTYPLGTLDECVDSILSLNANTDHVASEGYVVVDANYHRVKVKTPEYVFAHHFLKGNNVSKLSIISVARNEDSFNSLIYDYPNLAHIFKYYSFKLAETKHAIIFMVNYARRLFQEFNMDRKAVALRIKHSPYAHFGFKALNCDLSAEEIFDNITDKQRANLIPDYKPVKII